MKVLIIGTGPMACEYSKVLSAMGINTMAVGRGEKSAADFNSKTGLTALIGGYETYFKNNAQDLPSHCIIAVNENLLGQAARAAIQAGIKNILVEKPGGIDAADIRAVGKAAKASNAQVYIGYNRRFYASVEQVKSIISEDGGVLSFNFEFTEWGHVIRNLHKEAGVKDNWFLANSTHVIDLAFYVAGFPLELTAYSMGTLDWHKPAAAYAGAGITQTGALFSYQANWEAPGRWGIEFLTRNHRLYLRPMEKLSIQKLGTVLIEEYILDDSLDQDFKPGLYKQVEYFLQDPSRLLGIDEQIENLKWYEKMNKSD